MALEIKDCRTEYMENPIGIDVKRPRFSWRLESDKRDVIQTSFQICVKREDGTIIWDSGLVEDPEMAEVVYDGMKLSACTEYFWMVTVSDNYGESAESRENSFETGVMDSGKDAFGGAEWIGPSEYTLSSDVRSVFGYKCKFRIHENSFRVGFVFGRGDKRIKGRDNYFKYEIDATGEVPTLKLFRVGILPEDSADRPIAEVEIRDYDDPSHPLVLDKDNLHDFHTIDIQVTGNAAYTLIDDKRVDVTQKKTFFGEAEAPRTLNPYGDNDINTYPRLNQVGIFVPRGEGADFSLIEIRNLRKPFAVVYSDKNNYHIDSQQVSADPCLTLRSTAEGDVLFTKDPSHTSIPILRCEFELADKKIKKARLYATARGIYECRINGREVTDTWFNPGLTQYDRHLMYQTYDITELLNSGKNAIGVVLASGWWSDAQTFVLGNFNYFGDRESFLGRVEVTYEDGTIQNLVSNREGWKYYNEGPWTYAGFFHGEHFDAIRAERTERFSHPGYDDSEWLKPEIIPLTHIRKAETMSNGPISWPEVNVTDTELIGQIGDGVKVSYEISAVGVTEPEEGIYIYDMGVNVAGVPKLHLHGERGEKITLRYAELLYPDLPEFEGKVGTLMVENLRDADCTDIYTCAGRTEGEDYTPKFTFRGYRYIEISGVSKKPDLSEVKLLVLSSAYKMTSGLETSDETTNKFVENVRRSQQSNFISIPTDCPQRNERMGWDGDTSIFTRTATFHADVRMFYERWLMSMRDLQEESGKYADIAPIGGGFGGYTYESSALHCTWELYQQYGDRQIIRDNYESMVKFMDYSAGLWEANDLAHGFTLGDWLAPEETDLSLICHAFYGFNAFVMSEMAKAIGKESDAENYGKLFLDLKKSFNEIYFDKGTGKTKDDTQCSYALPLSYGMVEEKLISKVGNCLAEKTRKLGHIVNTGFFGTAPLNPMLTKTGHADDAYLLMKQKKCPSWLYPVTQGATSIWERWDSYTIENGFGGHNNMNSFNHYSLGAVVEWFYVYVLGIVRDENAPGYRHFFVRPYVNEAYDYVKGYFDSPYGKISASWKKDVAGKYIYSIGIPAGASATVAIPGEPEKEIGSGRHEFSVGII